MADFNTLEAGVVDRAGLHLRCDSIGLDLANRPFRPTQTRVVPHDLANLKRGPMGDCRLHTGPNPDAKGPRRG